ncbi:uncharacterized protein ATC70_009817 [Mucor velutinosus]|uniref:C2H2-type domain-containing protein n=1 Tax=Mucor velutinosus TaxID=708070 RepID=A0AAN7DQR9_9FUNG|nr:hypothetical protein ATC70_009817 [Mucor velutinosus]
MLKSLTKVHRKISQKARRLSQKKLNLSIKRRKVPAQGYQPSNKQEISIFDIRYPIYFNNYSTESFNLVQEYAQSPRVRHPDEDWKFNRATNEACEEPADDPNMLDLGRLNINNPMEQYDKKYIPTARISRRHMCRGCATHFNYITLTISSPDEINPTYCIGCERLFGSMSNFEVHQRLHHSTNMIKNNPVFETHFLNDISMHPHYGCAPPHDNRYTLFHLPCSPNYYKRFVNKYGDPKYVLCDVQPVIQDRLQHFYGCNGCRQFIEHERSPIYFDTVSIAGKYDMATHKEVLAFLSYNMTCMETGLQGCWSPTGKEFFSLQLELKTPVSVGGRGFLNNFKVSLVGIDSLLEMFDAEDVHRWLKAVKEHQGYYPPC